MQFDPSKSAQDRLALVPKLIARNKRDRATDRHRDFFKRMVGYEIPMIDTVSILSCPSPLFLRFLQVFRGERMWPRLQSAISGEMTETAAWHDFLARVIAYRYPSAVALKQKQQQSSLSGSGSSSDSSSHRYDAGLYAGASSSMAGGVGGLGSAIRPSDSMAARSELFARRPLSLLASK